MAEIIGLVASIGSLVQIAGQITKLSYSYVSDIKSAPKTQKHYLQEVSALTEVIEQADEGLLLAMKQLCADPAKQSTPAGLAELFAAACELKSTYLIVDGPDEVPKAEGLLPYLPFFVGAGCKIMVTSRDLRHIRKHMGTAVKMEVYSQIHDLELYISSRFQDSDFPDTEDFTEDIMRKSSNV
ncbi:unnamed protein product [Aspergillus oryzae]|nr:unnamed protein product [Aspergillus oryzae]